MVVHTVSPVQEMRSILLLSICLLGTVVSGSVYSKYSDDSSSTSEERDEPTGELWALLVAGSNTWWNYRHQADVAHAYHVCLDHGIAADRIIVMMYDDVANHPSNTYKGKLFNSPNYKDFYEGLQIDYRREAVNPENFLNVLKGNASGVVGGNGRVIESGPDDRVFVFFTDHGSPGLIAFPNGFLTAKQLLDTFKYMHATNRYADLVFYLEACESGSMFDALLPSTINVYAVSAANGRESSYGTYCENDRELPCLGDLFSVSWMEDSDEEDLTVETIGKQYKIVKNETNKSHVCHFGKLLTERDPVSWFQGGRKVHASRDRTRSNTKRFSAKYRQETAEPAREIEIRHLARILERSNDLEECDRAKARLEEIKTKNAHARRVMKAIVTLLYKDEEQEYAHEKRHNLLKKDHKNGRVLFPSCHTKVVEAFEKLCINPIEDLEYFIPHMFVLNNLCIDTNGDSDEIKEAIIEHCLIKHLF